MKPLLGFDDVDLSPLPDDSEALITRAAPERADGPVAIIGMSGRAGAAADLDQFWAMLLRGEEAGTGLSAERRADVEAYLTARGAATPVAPERYMKGTRLPSVAEFDHRFFSLSPQEAKTIDPNQRIFLETAWAALEDAGYLNKEIRGERVGVYTGMSADFGEDYRAVIQAVAPDAPEVSVAGNVKSIIGSRLSYLLDLKGPSLLIDTACSSGLVAAYTAFRAVQSGECTMAVVGAANTDLLPVTADASGIGFKDIQDTSSSDGRTRTFDRASEGTRPAEGCFVFVLKALDLAERDGDHIHAVVLGGAVNQDGASNGLTAPNADAQADLIEAALNDAGVGAEQIGYIEAHGTATRLGDPIEVSGITRAFARQTARKQFCAIGTVKTNIGHMDNASGLAGLAKLVLSMKHRTLPASLHFEEPNPNITFPQTPLYVNDTTAVWTDDPGKTLYAGINSFGLSGTNCHLVVRSPDPAPERNRAEGAAPKCLLLPLSARDAAGLRRLVERYRSFLAAHGDVDLADLAYTASVGRLHHQARAAFTFASRAELAELLGRFPTVPASADDPDLSGDAPSDLVHGEFRAVLERSATTGPGALTEAERALLSDRAGELLAAGARDRDALRRVAALYVRGADVDWASTAPADARRIPLPTHPFERTRCWVESGHRRPAGLTGDAALLRSWDRDVLVSRIGPDTMWELAEHRIQGVSVLPGTGLVEMIVETLQRLGRGTATTLRNIRFELPLAVPDGTLAEVHVVVETGDDSGRITVATRQPDGAWVRNATAEVLDSPVSPATYDIENVRGRMTRDLVLDDDVDRANGLIIGERWTGSVLYGLADDDGTELLYAHELPAAYRDEAHDYVLHPALLDALINAPNTVYEEDRLYLPFSYGRLTLHRPLPPRVFTHFRKRPESLPGQLYVFDVCVVDPEGHVVLTVDNYCIKSAAGLDLTQGTEYGWVPSYRRTTTAPAPAPGRGTVLLAGGFGDALEALTKELRAAGHDVVHVPDAGDPVAVDRLGGNRAFAFGLLGGAPADPAAPLADRTVGPVEDVLALLGAVSEHRCTFDEGLLVLTRNAFAVTGRESTVDPGQAGVAGLARVAALEYQGLAIRCLDGDEHTGPARVLAEARAADRPAFLLDREGQSYEPHLAKSPVPLRPEGELPLPADGVIVVSGGTGGLGTAVARQLARQGARRLVLLGSPVADPAREPHLDGVHAEIAAEVEHFEIVRLALEDRESVEQAVGDIRARHGRISAVLHLAGRPGIGFLHTKSTEAFRDVYRPKALGGVHLHEATLADDLEHFVVFSSIAALEPTAGQADYTAANAALDSLAQLRDRTGAPSLSIQWPAWRETGMAMRLDAVDEDEVFPPLDTAEAVDLLAALMSRPDRPTVLMPGTMRAPAAGSGADRVRAAAPGGGREVVLHGMEHVGEIERSVAEIWAATLDVPEVDAYDDFGELGGNSLLIAQMSKLYDARYPGLMDVVDLFRYTSVAAQAAHLKEKLGITPAEAAEAVADAPVPAADDGEIDRLLDLAEQGVVSTESSPGLIQESEVTWKM
ncbi:SDR family NAD(P)-dependent oxidoreductase [Streptomyces globisporus]|uniref:SDR family NAD(P)-dependent oxidoreductase n=1 Tax=Streptomyces globisporus TaxID=1908 RepID=A0A423UZW6_STRGL|nr:SDR family NAD(P)-dependent oxidoreductase [Streptomyces globisporus]ROV67881.1 SDR family NAD(P)-dependent oxidoreductase [Streptomyces globisporus]